jgi:hypothetical protein
LARRAAFARRRGHFGKVPRGDMRTGIMRRNPIKNLARLRGFDHEKSAFAIFRRS